MLEANRLLCSFDIESAIDRNIQMVAVNTPLIEAIALMSQGQSPEGMGHPLNPLGKLSGREEDTECCLFAIDDNQAVNLLTTQDIVKFLGTGQSLEKATVAAVMQKCLIFIKESECGDVSPIFTWFQQGIRYLPVVSDTGNGLVGVLTPSRLMQKFNFSQVGNFFDDSLQSQQQKSVELSSHSYPEKPVHLLYRKSSKSDLFKYKKRQDGSRINRRIRIIPYKIKNNQKTSSEELLPTSLKIQPKKNALPTDLRDSFLLLDILTPERKFLTATEEQLLAVLAVMSEIVLIIDETGNQIKVAPTHPALVQSKQSSELISQTLEKFFNGSHSETFLSQIRQSLETQTPIQFEYSLNVGKHQKQFTASISPLPTTRSVIWVARDITDFKQTVQFLQYSQSLLAGVLNSSLDGIMAFKAIRNAEETIIDFQWVSVNPPAEKLLGRSATELVGHYMLEELPGNQAVGLFERYVEVVNTGNLLDVEIYYDHEKLRGWFKVIAVKFGDGFTVTFRNITEGKQSEETLQQANEKLIQWIEELKQRNREMVLLGEMNELLQACETVEEAYKAIGIKLPQLFPKCSGGLGAIDSFKNCVKNVAAWGKLPGSKPWFEPHECWALRRGRSHAVDNSPLSLFCNHIHPQSFPVESLCIPMMAQGEISGLLYLISPQEGRLSEAKQQLARTVSEQIALALANIKLRETLHDQSIRDSLTGLFNRRYLEETLERELQRAYRQDQSVGVVMIDIDHFKHFNDTFGHDAGDAVLRQVGELLIQNIRGSDIACRYGGEELTLILPGATLSDTYRRAEQIREAIKNLALEHRGELLGIITASLGIACFPVAGETGEDLIRAADTALYRAKALGRDRVITAGSYPA